MRRERNWAGSSESRRAFRYAGYRRMNPVSSKRASEARPDASRLKLLQQSRPVKVATSSRTHGSTVRAIDLSVLAAPPSARQLQTLRIWAFTLLAPLAHPHVSGPTE